MPSSLAQREKQYNCRSSGDKEARLILPAQFTHRMPVFAIITGCDFLVELISFFLSWQDNKLFIFGWTTIDQS